MEFESLQSIWDTQNDKPVFAMQDARLLVALYQQREHSRRRIFKQQLLPLYIIVPIGLVGVGLTFFAFFWKSFFRENLGGDFPMSVWDYVAFAVVAVALVAMVVPLYTERKKHERTQQVFAPSLREELDRGISQLDFELSLYRTPRVLTFYGLMTIAVALFVWEMGRLNGNSAMPWEVWMNLAFMAVAIWPSLIAMKAAIKQLMTRRRALESMRAALDENVNNT